jgi:hypothetical protein
MSWHGHRSRVQSCRATRRPVPGQGSGGDRGVGDERWCRPLTIPKTKTKPEIFTFGPGTTPEVWQRLDWTSITTIAFAGPAPRDLVCDAHRRGVRVVVLTGLMPEAAITTPGWRRQGEYRHRGVWHR